MAPRWRLIVAGFYLLQGILTFGIGVGITDMMLGNARPGHQSAYIIVTRLSREHGVFPPKGPAPPGPGP